jgi:hypothetical protein
MEVLYIISIIILFVFCVARKHESKDIQTDLNYECRRMASQYPFNYFEVKFVFFFIFNEDTDLTEICLQRASVNGSDLILEAENLSNEIGKGSLYKEKS